MQELRIRTGVAAARTHGADALAREALPQLAEEALLQTRLLVNNPRPVDREAALALYQEAW